MRYKNWEEISFTWENKLQDGTATPCRCPFCGALGVIDAPATIIENTHGPNFEKYPKIIYARPSMRYILKHLFRYWLFQQKLYWKRKHWGRLKPLHRSHSL